MRSYYNTRHTDSTREEKSAIDFVNIFTTFNSPNSLQTSKELLNDLKVSLPRYEGEINSILKFILIQESWNSATPSEKKTFSLHLSGIRSKQLKGIPKGFFIFKHEDRARSGNFCTKTSQRSNVSLERTGVIKTAIRKKIGPNKTINMYYREKSLIDLRVLRDSDLFINYIDDDGMKYFLPLTEYIKIRVSNLQKIDENAKKNSEKNLRSQRQCLPNYIELRYINNSKGNFQKKGRSKIISEYMKEKLERGILHKDLSSYIKIAPEDIPKFAWYNDDEVTWAFDAVQNMPLSSFEKLKKPAHYMLTACKNRQNGDTSWKTSSNHQMQWHQSR